MLYILSRTRAAAFVLIIALLFGACKKEGILQEGPDVARVTVTPVFSDPDLRLTLHFNDRMLRDSMLPTQQVESITRLQAGKQHLVLTNSTTKEIIIDTLLDLPRPYAKIIIFKLGTAPDSKAMLVVPGGESVEPGTAHVSFFTDNAHIPSGIDVYVYPVYQDEFTWEMKVDMSSPTVISDIRKGVLTDVTVLNRYPMGMFAFELRDKTGALVQGFGNNEVKPDDWTAAGNFVLFDEPISTTIFTISTVPVDGVPYVISPPVVFY